MSDKTELKVGDRVRIVEEEWVTERGVERGKVVTVDAILEKTGVPWSNQVGMLLDYNGDQFEGWTLEKVEDADDSNEQATADACALAEIRADYEFKKRYQRQSWMTLAMSDVDLLLRIADEYQELRRSLVDGGDLQNEINEKISNP